MSDPFRLDSGIALSGAPSDRPDMKFLLNLTGARLGFVQDETQLPGKTVTSASDTPVYQGPAFDQPILGSVPAGTPFGVLNLVNMDIVWLMVQVGADGTVGFAPYIPEDINLTGLAWLWDTTKQYAAAVVNAPQKAFLAIGQAEVTTVEVAKSAASQIASGATSLASGLGGVLDQLGTAGKWLIVGLVAFAAIQLTGTFRRA